MEWKILGVYLLLCGFFAYENRKALVAAVQPLSSPVNWCEKDYEVTEYIVEFWNSLSSLFLFAVAFVAPRYLDERVNEHEPKIFLMWLIMALVGLGSTYFHGSLSILGQVTDELPISLLAMYGCFLLRPMNRWNLKLRGILFSLPFLIGLTVGLTLISTLYPIVSHIFCVSWMPIVLYQYIHEYRIGTPECKRQVFPLFMTTVGTFVAAFTCWIVDRLACEQVTELFGGNYPQLHAFWHIFIGFTFIAIILTGAILRCHQDGVKIVLEPSVGFPRVTLGKVL